MGSELRYASSFTPSPTLGASRDLPLARPQSSVRGPRRAGLEHTCFALANADMLWIDPLDYRDDLADGVDVLATAGVAVSDNLPRCVLARSTWPFAAQSISDWKKGYLEQCDRCVERPRCSGQGRMLSIVLSGIYSKGACAAYAALPTVEQTPEQGTRDLSRKPDRLTGMACRRRETAKLGSCLHLWLRVLTRSLLQKNSTKG